MSPEARLPRIVIVLLLAAGLAGLGHAAITPSARPIQIGLGDDVGDLVVAASDRLLGRYYTFYVELSRVSHDGVLIVPSEHPLSAYDAMGIGAIDLITRDDDQEPSPQALEQLEADVAASGVFFQRPSRDEYRYVIVRGQGTLHLVVSANELWAIPESVWREVVPS